MLTFGFSLDFNSLKSMSDYKKTKRARDDETKRELSEQVTILAAKKAKRIDETLATKDWEEVLPELEDVKKAFQIISKLLGKFKAKKLVSLVVEGYEDKSVGPSSWKEMFERLSKAKGLVNLKLITGLDVWRKIVDHIRENSVFLTTMYSSDLEGGIIKLDSLDHNPEEKPLMLKLSLWRKDELKLLMNSIEVIFPTGEVLYCEQYETYAKLQTLLE